LDPKLPVPFLNGLAMNPGAVVTIRRLLGPITRRIAPAENP